ncbi:MAG: tetratricopeptide repeat protein [Planctomycetota bacterium]|nr:tetratricopeptide repeat protein [Planctomycetota bacterium]
MTEFPTLDSGLKKHRAGMFDEAAAVYREILEAEPENGDAWRLLGTLMHQRGDSRGAINLLSKSLRFDPENADTFTNLGEAWRAIHEYERALDSFRKAIAIRPNSHIALNNIGCVLLSQERAADAEKVLTKATRLKPDYAEAFNNLGRAKHAQGQHDAAEEAYNHALGLRPDSAQAWNNLGNVYRERGEVERAEEAYRKALELDPDLPEAITNQANMHVRRRRPEDAEREYRKAVTASPQDPRTHFALAEFLRTQKRNDEAELSFRRAVELNPGMAHAHGRLAQLHLDAKKWDLCVASFRRAVSLKPDWGDAKRLLATALLECGETSQAIAQLEGVLEATPDQQAARYRAATALPVIYQKASDITDYRERVEQKVDELHKSGFRFDPLTTQPEPLFYLAYQGFDDCSLQRKLAELFDPVSPDLTDQRGKRDPQDGRIHVGFVSRLLKSHTIGHLNRGMITRLPKDKFKVHVFLIGVKDDEITKFISDGVDECVHVSCDLDQARREILKRDLDIIHYPDLGMSNTTMALARCRMAPKQSATWGHPVTSGLPSIDYFISSEDLETEGCDAYYTEQLIRFKSLSNYYFRPSVPIRPRSYFGIPEDRNVYGIPQSLFKFLPEWDQVLGDILRNDPKGLICILRPWVDAWSELLLRRLCQSLPDVADRILFVPRQGRRDFIALNACFDVLLDPIHFGGGNTNYECFPFGTPIVTWPSKFLKGRITYAQYRKMGVMDCIADSIDEYAGLAVKLGTDVEFRRDVQSRIKSKSEVLYCDQQAVDEYTTFFESIAG